MKAYRVVLGGFAVAMSIGCSGGDEWTENLPETVEASGVVTMDGQPVEGATIVFSPESGTHAGHALTDSSGRFSASAFPSKGGMVPGSYKVAVNKTVERKGKPTTGPDAAHDPPGGNVEWYNALPEKFMNPNSSGLTATVPEGGTTDLKFELKK